MKTQKLLLFLMEIYIDYLFLYVSNISRNSTEKKKRIYNLKVLWYILIKIVPQDLGCVLYGMEVYFE